MLDPQEAEIQVTSFPELIFGATRGGAENKF